MADPILNCPVCFDPFEWDSSHYSSDVERFESKLPVLSYVCSHKVCCSCLHGMQLVAISGTTTNRVKSKWFKCPSCNVKTAFNIRKMQIDAYACECIKRLTALQGDSISAAAGETEAQRCESEPPKKKRQKKVYDCEFDSSESPTSIEVTSSTIVPGNFRVVEDVVGDEAGADIHSIGTSMDLENATSHFGDGSHETHSGASLIVEATGTDKAIENQRMQSPANGILKDFDSTASRTKRKSTDSSGDLDRDGEICRPTRSMKKSLLRSVGIGSRIEIYWGSSNYYPAQYYPATVMSISKDAEGVTLFKLNYDDGYEASTDLSKELFNVLDEPRRIIENVPPGKVDRAKAKESDPQSQQRRRPKQESEKARDIDEEKEEFPDGTALYIEYQDLLYRATVLTKRVIADSPEYYVHFDDLINTSNRWIKYAFLHKRTAYTLRRYNKERRNAVARNRTTANRSVGTKNNDVAKLENSSTCSERLSAPEWKHGIDEAVYVDSDDVLYKATIVGRRLAENGSSQYLVHYHGYSKTHDEWVGDERVYSPQSTFRRREPKLIDWIQCDQCSKWRVLPSDCPVENFSGKSFSCNQISDPLHNSCLSPEQTEMEVNWGIVTHA